MLKPKEPHSEETQEQVLKAAQERVSLRGIERIFGVCRQTVAKWIKAYLKQLPVLADTLLLYEVGDVLEIDELWSFVAKKSEKRWLWTAICRRTRQIVAFIIGDRSEATCRQLWQAIPRTYRNCHSFSDFWKAYAKVLPKSTHQSKGKETGETTHQERWYNTLRQWLGRYTRKTLSFSKLDFYHELVTRWFIIEHNLRMRSSLTT